MFCEAALTFPNSGYGLLVVAMFRMVIVGMPAEVGAPALRCCAIRA